MNGMRMKSHKPQFNQTNLPKPDKFTRYTPLGAIRLLPPLPTPKISGSTVIAASRPAKKRTQKKTATSKSKAAVSKRK